MVTGGLLLLLAAGGAILAVCLIVGLGYLAAAQVQRLRIRVVRRQIRKLREARTRGW